MNGARVAAPVSLKDRDEVRLGLVSFVYRAPSPPVLSATKTAV